MDSGLRRQNRHEYNLTDTLLGTIDIALTWGAGAYIVGDETGLLESLSGREVGRRGWKRRRFLECCHDQVTLGRVAPIDRGLGDARVGRDRLNGQPGIADLHELPKRAREDALIDFNVARPPARRRERSCGARHHPRLTAWNEGWPIDRHGRPAASQRP